MEKEVEKDLGVTGILSNSVKCGLCLGNKLDIFEKYRWCLSLAQTLKAVFVFDPK